MTRAVVRSRGQITLPREIREVLRIEEGDDVAFVISDDTVTIRGLKSIPAEQAWFWTEEWQAGEREASDQLASGEGTVYDDGDTFLDSLG
ncbi:MAG: AbrB/MazE/SpoVT family DNA-binding domain-containing protein [Actinomycetota bacterium]|jgi:AbrB family looped-hinge helix DNA binding protein|nr:AbrB/MazE/SpoVT family DNA-binding domain-containing protein [Actinomycetota bacterium]